MRSSVAAYSRAGIFNLCVNWNGDSSANGKIGMENALELFHKIPMMQGSF